MSSMADTEPKKRCPECGSNKDPVIDQFREWVSPTRTHNYIVDKCPDCGYAYHVDRVD